MLVGIVVGSVLGRRSDVEILLVLIGLASTVAARSVVKAVVVIEGNGNARLRRHRRRRHGVQVGGSRRGGRGDVYGVTAHVGLAGHVVAATKKRHCVDGSWS